MENSDINNSTPHPLQTEPASNTAVLQELHSYPFETDEEYKIGLAVILGHPNTPPTEEELRRNDDLALQAKCFYYSRKKGINPPLDFSTYKAWLSAPSLTPSESHPTISTSASGTTHPARVATATSTPSSAPVSTTAEPSYPSSFAHIVELITTGQPIPGIQQIPDTVLAGKEAPSTAAKRRKPWEKSVDDTEVTEDDGQVSAT